MKTSYLINTKKFHELSLDELYQIMALRMSVFCVEQDCPYQDLDNEDQNSLHVMMMEEGRLIAYARALEKNKHSSIGRVVVDQSQRKKGLAHKLMEHSMAACHDSFPGRDIVISAQSYLKSFYTKLGFESLKEYYLEDDIPHEKMIYRSQS